MQQSVAVWEGAWQHEPMGKWQSKMQWDITSLRLQWLKKQTIEEIKQKNNYLLKGTWRKGWDYKLIQWKQFPWCNGAWDCHLSFDAGFILLSTTSSSSIHVAANVKILHFLIPENMLLHIGHISYIHSPAGCENKERWERNLRSSC